MDGAALVVCARAVVGLCATGCAAGWSGWVAAAPKVDLVGDTGREEARPGRGRGGIISEPEPRLARERAEAADADADVDEEVDEDEAVAAMGTDVGASYRLARAIRAEAGALAGAAFVGEVLRRCKSAFGRSLRCGDAVCSEICGST